MKKILYILLTVFIGFSCKDFNENNFDWYEDAERPTNVASYEYTVTDADYTIIVNALKATGVEENVALANKLNTAKKFTPELPPETLIPYLLEKKYLAMDVKSSAKITYQYDDARDEQLSGLSGVGYTMKPLDYLQVWGSTSSLVASLTPSKPAKTAIPAVLKSRYPNAKDGEYKTVEYNYASTEPVTSTVDVNYSAEDFEKSTAGTGVAVAIKGWTNKDLKGKMSWECRNYSGNNYAQVSAYKAGTETENWLITDQIDLTAVIEKPQFSFDIVTGNYNGSGLGIYISENYDGTDIAKATWTDITSSFTIPAPDKGYSTWASAGKYDLSAYKNKKVYIAFKYSGNDSSSGTKLTTTYQLDNIKIFETFKGVNNPQYASFMYSEANKSWAAVGSSVIVLQTPDYEKVGLTSNVMTAVLAKDLLPQYMRNVIGTEGLEKIVVYRPKAGEYYAERFTFTGGAWVLDTTLSEKTSQFIYAPLTDKKAWIFDPTIIIPISKDDYQLIVDYVKEHYYEGNEGVWDTRGNAEYYFGFSQYYGNISYREASYRDKDNTYPLSGTTEEKLKFMNDRTKQAFEILLTLKYPNATPMISGVEQFARFDNIVIYSEPNAGTNVTWSYTFQCVGDKEWKFVSRESNDGRSEVAPK